MLHCKRKWFSLDVTPCQWEQGHLFPEQPTSSQAECWDYLELNRVSSRAIWIKDFRAAVLSRSVSSRWVCVWEYRAHGNCDLLSKAGLLLGNPCVGELGGKTKGQAGSSNLQTLPPLRWCSPGVLQGTLASKATVLKGRGLARSSAPNRNLPVPLDRNSTIDPSLAGAEVAGSSPPSCPSC